ncbi:hypothetical protein TEA_014642 [Camellia sinensis var. sinensis]|uniref:Molybdopterin biosynthesis protein CNX1 n=1 Tax=Camellia sinensis var. sinensis TaxID=542762 RepID=A0A4S4D6Y8_CAMSN|nr:hypothetical protein TEA_014642 [Camellia sinensis var. sinensis]
MAENDGSRVSSSDHDHQSKPTTMISADNALQIVLNVAQRLPPVTVSLHEALGKVLAHDITAPDPLPPYPASIKNEEIMQKENLDSKRKDFQTDFRISLSVKTAGIESQFIGNIVPEQDGYAVVASDGPGEYPIITESRAGNDGVGVTVTPGTVAYVTTGGVFVYMESIIVGKLGHLLWTSCDVLG